MFAGAVALLYLARVLLRPGSGSHLLVETFVTALAVSAVFWLAWIALWLIEQRR